MSSRNASFRSCNSRSIRPAPTGITSATHPTADRSQQGGHEAMTWRRYGPGKSSGPTSRADVPDPYYGGPADFELVLDLLEGASRRLLHRLAA